MAKHRHHRHSYRHFRRNPLGVSSSDLKDVLVQIGGFAGANYGSTLFNQSGWIDVLATAGIAIGLRYVGGELGSDLFKGALFAAGLKAVKQTGVSVPGLSSYVDSYFPIPTNSDAYGRTSAPMLALPPMPAGAPGRGMGAGPVGAPYGRYRTRFMTRW